MAEKTPEPGYSRLAVAAPAGAMREEAPKEVGWEVRGEEEVG